MNQPPSPEPTEKVHATSRRSVTTPARKLRFSKRLLLSALRCYFTLTKRTVRLCVVNDPRDRIRYHSSGQFVYAILHAHQTAAIALSDPNTGALVSRSRDGDLLVPLLQSCGCVPIRGSSGAGRKGGATALSQLIQHCQQGHAAVIAVDGPKGPRGKVQKGAAMLAQKASVPVLPVVLVARRRWLFARAWDRMQLPLPFSRIDCRFGEPITVSEDSDLDEMTQRIEISLAQLESIVDPEEAAIARSRAQPKANDKMSTARHGNAPKAA